VYPLTRGRRSRRSRAAGSAGREIAGIVERHLRLVALEGDNYPAPRRPADDVPRGRVGGGADWLGDRFGGDSANGGEADGGRSGRAGSGPRVDVRVTDARPASRIADRAAGAPAPWADPTEGAVEPPGRAARPERGASTARLERRLSGPEGREGREAHEGHESEFEPEWRLERRPVRLTRRGRLVVLALVLVVGALVGFLGAAPGQAADPPAPVVTAVVEPGDTLWSFSERNLPNWQPRAGVAELKRLNDLEGYVIHPGQRLALPARR
jgi:hypothetical protein